jgi:hypothetical protein
MFLASDLWLLAIGFLHLADSHLIFRLQYLILEYDFVIQSYSSKSSV